MRHYRASMKHRQYTPVLHYEHLNTAGCASHTNVTKSTPVYERAT